MTSTSRIVARRLGRGRRVAAGRQQRAAVVLDHLDAEPARLPVAGSLSWLRDQLVR